MLCSDLFVFGHYDDLKYFRVIEWYHMQLKTGFKMLQIVVIYLVITMLYVMLILTPKV
jgi:hypothetical protein